MTQTVQTQNDATVFLGRQPIFDRRQKVFGYELLYRHNAQSNAATFTDGDLASCQVINTGLNVLPFQEIVGDRRAFINVTRQLLIDRTYTVLPREHVVLELLEEVQVDPFVLEACEQLKADGYMLALDDFVYAPQARPLLQYADIVKVDFRQSPPAQRRELARRLSARHDMLLLAEKVETREDFCDAIELGYAYFQGYFFCKPEILSRRELPAVKQSIIRFLHEVHRPEIDYNRLEQTIKSDLSLSTKLLRYLNCAAIGLPNKLTSIRQGLALLGEKQLRKWASLAALSSLASDKPEELLCTCLARARFCESLAIEARLANQELDAFLMGLFSGMDALLDMPMDQAIKGLPVSPAVATALTGGDSPLARIYQLALAFENGDPPLLEQRAAAVSVSLNTASALYWQALRWVDQSKLAA